MIVSANFFFLSKNKKIIPGIPIIIDSSPKNTAEVNANSLLTPIKLNNATALNSLKPHPA